MQTIPLKFSGMNNKARDESLPDGKFRNAVNVIFTDAGTILLPRPGSALKYAGNCHSLYKTPLITLFVNDGNLKRLNDDNTATTLKSGMGDSKVYYALVGDTIYFANEITKGKIRNGVASEWGTARPPRQPDCVAISSGGLFAGDYLVAITWIADEEGPTGMSVRVTVNEGGGIQLSNFPVPPDYVDYIGVYVTAVNSEDMYLYGEFPAATQHLTIDDTLSTVPLATQFGFTPSPQGALLSHYGRIYFAMENRLHYTEIHRYGLVFPGNFWPFDSDIQTIISHPNVLYVGTLNNQYEIRNIDWEEPPIIKTLINCGSVKGSECYDADGDTAYFVSDRGFIKATEEGLAEMSYDQCAIPFFGKGTSTVAEYDGTKYLLFTGQDGVQNPLANVAYNAAELARGSL